MAFALLLDIGGGLRYNPARMNRLLRRAPLIALALYAILTVVYTRPLILHLTDAIAGGNTDGWNNYWNYWWTPFALGDLHRSPFRTDWLFYQSGSTLYFHTLQPLNGLISWPFQLLGHAFAVNAITFISYILTAWFTYLLARLLLQRYIADTSPHPTLSPEGRGEAEDAPTTSIAGEGSVPSPPAPPPIPMEGSIPSPPASPPILVEGSIVPASVNVWQQGGPPPAPTQANQHWPQHSALSTQHSALLEAAAFLAGLAFCFASPWRTQYLYGGQDNRLAIEWLPLFLYFAYRAYFRQRWRDATFAAAALVACALTELQYVVYVAMFVLIFLLVELIGRGWRAWRQPALRVAGGVVAAIIVLSPLLYIMLRELAQNPSLAPGTGATIFHSTDLLELFVPNRTNLLWGGLANGLDLAPYDKYLIHGAFSPPYVIIILGIIGLVLAWQWLQTKTLFINLLTFLLISLGPLLHVNGSDTFTPFGGNLLMPYAFLYYLPFMKVSRDPERFGEMAFLFWSLLAAIGLFALLRRMTLTLPSTARGEGKWTWAYALVAVVLLLTVAEFVSVEPPITPVNTPAFYQQLAADKERYAVMELPIYKGGDEDQWFSYQAVHHKYLFGGDLARKQSYPFVQYTPVLNWFWAQGLPTADIVPNPPTAAALPVLRWANVRYLALIKTAVDGQKLDSARELINSAWGANVQPTYSDAVMDVYQVAPITSTTALTPMLAVGAGWYAYEKDDAGGHRWLSGDEYNTDGYLTVLNLGNSGNYTLSFRAFSYAKPLPVEVKYQGQTLTTLTLSPSPQTYSIPLSLGPNRSEIIFHILNQPISPKDIGAGNDPRLLSVGVGNVTLRLVYAIITV